MAESLASTRVSASMGLPTGHVIEDAAAEGLGRAKANSMDPFDELLRQLRMFHQGEVQRLREEVLSLQSQRLSTDMQAPAFLQKQTDAEVMEMAEAVAESQGMNNHGEKEGRAGCQLPWIPRQATKSGQGPLRTPTIKRMRRAGS